jgi:hypothetical protein
MMTTDQPARSTEDRQEEEDLAAISRAAELGREHAEAGVTPYGDLEDAGSAVLMTDLGQTEPTTGANHPARLAMLDAYTRAREAARAGGRTPDREPEAG